MSVLACGLNTSQQILAAGPSILCCPSPVCLPTGITAASVAFSHILWKTDSGWHWTGHDAESYKQEKHIKSSWKVSVCENRLAAISDSGSVLVWRKEWRTLHFQKEHLDGRLDESTMKDERHKTDKEKTSTDLDIMEPKLSEVAYENTKCTNEQINSCYEIYSNEKCRDQEGMNKRLKVEHSAEKKDKPCDKESTEISFSKVAIEDNLLLALDTDGVMYWGNISVPLRMKVSDVAVGKEHCMALTAAGDVITWGDGMRGQLGIGELCSSEKPVPVESLLGVRITSITCGAWHCAALSESGDLYVWGWNETGQLGFLYNSESSYPLFLFFEHLCQCPKGSHSQRDLTQRSRSKDEEDVSKEEGNNRELDERINPEREIDARISPERELDARINPEREPDARINPEREPDARINPERELDARINPEREVEARINPERELDARINPERELDARINPERELDARINPERELDARINPEREPDARINPERELDARVNPERELDARINPERSQEVINVQASPRLLDFWREDVNIRDVQCGDRHTLFILQDGSVWSVGMNRYGQLGVGHIRAVREPCEVFRGGISAIYAGGWNSIFISSRDQSASLKV